MLPKIALAPLLKDEKIGAGGILVIGNDEIGSIAIRNPSPDSKGRVGKIGAAFSCLKAFIAAMPAGRKGKSRKIENRDGMPPFQPLPKRRRNAAAIPSRASAKGHDADFHILSPFPLFQAKYITALGVLQPDFFPGRKWG